MKKLIFATNNQHKLEEIRLLANHKFEILSLVDIGFEQDIHETGFTFNANALIKAETIFRKYNKPVFADDSGLEIEALKNAPGVYSKRYAGEHATDAENRAKVLHTMQNITHRNARFVTVIVLIYNDVIHYFEGDIKGEILYEEIGNNGFGYDSIFKPFGSDISMAQMTMNEKNKMSHRSQALAKMMQYIDTHILENKAIKKK